MAFASGLVLLLLWFLLSLRRLGRERPVLTLATLAVLLVDCAALVMGGSYWRPYLFGLVPAAVLALALLASGTPATCAPAGTQPRRDRASWSRCSSPVPLFSGRAVGAHLADGLATDHLGAHRGAGSPLPV